MGNLLFSPKGRIGPSEFTKGAIILIAISFMLGLLPLVSIKLAMVGNLIGLVLLWCWIVLWVKRFHDGGQSGWMTLVPIGAFIGLSMLASMMLMPMFVSDMVEQQLEMQKAIEEAAQGGDASTMLNTTLEAAGAMAKKQAIPSAIINAVVSGIVANVGNMLIKHDPDDNQYGSASGASAFD